MHPSELHDYFHQLIRSRSRASRDLIGLEFENAAIVPARNAENSYELPCGEPFPWVPLPMGAKSGVQRVLEEVIRKSPTEKPWIRLEEEQEGGGRMLLGIQEPQGWNITVEPGGQLELSDAPRETLQQVHDSLRAHLVRVQEALDLLEGRMLCMGVNPFFSPEQLPLLAKHRYRIMYDHMPKVGTLGRWMMKASSGVQVNLDYHSVEDLERKARVLNRAAPFLAALFANSPLTLGKVNGYQSYRTHIWSDTDSTRSGLPEAFLKPNFRASDYVDWALNASSYLLKQDGHLIWTAGHSFRELMNGAMPGFVPEMSHWEAHLGMMFPDIRVKNIIEVRVFDSLPADWVIAIPALLKGLVYHEAGLVGAEELLFPIKSESFVDLRQAAAKQAMKGEVGSVDLGDVGRRLMEIALMALGSEEESWLLPYFEQFTKEKRTPADGVLERFALSRGPADWVEQEWNATGFLEGRLPRNPIPVVSGPTPGVQAPN